MSTAEVPTEPTGRLSLSSLSWLSVRVRFGAVDQTTSVGFRDTLRRVHDEHEGCLDAEAATREEDPIAVSEV